MTTDDVDNWRPLFVKKDNFSFAHWQRLASQEAACLVIDDFYPIESCTAISRAVMDSGLQYSFKAQNVEAHYSGRAAIELAREKETYFQGVAEANEHRKSLLGENTNPLDLVIKLLQRIWPPGAQIALEDGESYFAGVIRIFRLGVVHNDFAPRDMRGWHIASIRQQFSWNLFLQTPETGGEFVIWKRYWETNDEPLYKYDSRTMKGYKSEVISNCPSVVVEPKEGRLVLFDSRNYHDVSKVIGERQRLAMSAFIGLIDEHNPLLLWS